MSQQSWSGLNYSSCALAPEYRVTNSKQTAPPPRRSKAGERGHTTHLCSSPFLVEVAKHLEFIPSQEFCGGRQLPKITGLGCETPRWCWSFW